MLDAAVNRISAACKKSKRSVNIRYSNPIKDKDNRRYTIHITRVSGDSLLELEDTIMKCIRLSVFNYYTNLVVKYSIKTADVLLMHIRIRYYEH